jgi:peptidoglycan/LPS O-acetylase OafA/YrhL
MASRETNNFDAVRVIAAGSVLTGHMWPTHHHVSPFGDLAAFGVFTFFAISGYLVSASWERDPNAFRFLARRALRILPGLACALLIAAFVIGPLVTDLPSSQYFREPGVLTYVESIFLYPMQFELPGVFVHNPLPYSVNDSLWTIPTEAALYVCLAAIGLTLWRIQSARLPMLATLLAAGFALELTPSALIGQETVRNATCFVYGALLWNLRGRIPFVSWAWMPACAAMALCHGNTEVQALVMLIATPYCAISFGAASTSYVCRVGRFGDFSYGLYIYAFLIQQTLMYAFPRISFGMFFAAVTALSIGAGILSWHLIEKRAMRFKPSANAKPAQRAGAAVGAAAEG